MNWGGAMNETEKEIKERDITIAENESKRQITGAIRVSVWAIGVAVLIGLAVFGWMLAR
jgi:cell division septal protein FtsQ